MMLTFEKAVEATLNAAYLPGTERLCIARNVNNIFSHYPTNDHIVNLNRLGLR